MDGHSPGSLGFKNILHLTDFSSCSDAALLWAIGLARESAAKLCVLHVLIPDALTYMTPDSPGSALELQEEWARREIERIKAQLADLPHETIVARGRDVWSVAEARVGELGRSLIVLGTHGRTGLRRILMGSVAERVLRSSAVPVLTVGPAVSSGLRDKGTFHRVLLATDFAAGSAEAACYAVYFAERNEAELVLVHACKKGKPGGPDRGSELSAAEVMHRLHEMIPHPNELRRRPEMLVEYGDPGVRILEVARRKEADLIVMGIRNTGSMFAATHLEMRTAHNVVAQAACPVLTVRPRTLQAA